MPSWSLAADIFVPVAQQWAKQHGEVEYQKVRTDDADDTECGIPEDAVDSAVDEGSV